MFSLLSKAHASWTATICSRTPSTTRHRVSNFWSETQHGEFPSARLFAGETQEPFWTDGRSTLGCRRHEAHFAGQRNVVLMWWKSILDRLFSTLRTRVMILWQSCRTMECWTIRCPWVSPIVPASRNRDNSILTDFEFWIEPVLQSIEATWWTWSFMKIGIAHNAFWLFAKQSLAHLDAKNNLKTSWLREIVTWHQSRGLFWGWFFFLDDFALTLNHVSS